jgi:hypothetical protein
MTKGEYNNIVYNILEDFRYAANLKNYCERKGEKKIKNAS